MVFRTQKFALACVLWICWTQVGHGRLLDAWPYEKLNKHSDIVVIAEAVRVEPTKDKLSIPQWKQIEWAGRNTVFKVKSTIKGQPETDHITVLHFRIAEIKGGDVIDGPLLANFTKKREYMLFLKKRPDGRFELVSGQIDPVLAIRELSLPYHMDGK